MNWECYSFISVLVLVDFLIYLTAVHSMGLAKVWITQGLTVIWYIAWSRCLWLMDLMTVQTIRIFLDYCVVWMWQSTHAFTTTVSHSVATSSSESLPSDGEKLNHQRGFCFPNAIIERFLWSIHFNTQYKWYS